MYSLAEAYDVVNQRGLSKWQSKNIYSAKSINTSITFMIQNHSITKWQRSGMNNLYSDQILTATCPLHFLLVGHINTELLTPLKNLLWNEVAAQHRDFTRGTRGKTWTWVLDLETFLLKTLFYFCPYLLIPQVPDLGNLSSGKLPSNSATMEDHAKHESDS